MNNYVVMTFPINGEVKAETMYSFYMPATMTLIEMSAVSSSRTGALVSVGTPDKPWRVYRDLPTGRFGTAYRYQTRHQNDGDRTITEGTLMQVIVKPKKAETPPKNILVVLTFQV